MEVLTFASSGVPLGINIPNYDDIRQNEGFKNVYLGNVLKKREEKKIRFLKNSEAKMYSKNFTDSMFVKVALHEMMGHGSGKLFMKNKEGEYNFDLGKVMNPLTK